MSEIEDAFGSMADDFAPLPSLQPVGKTKAARAKQCHVKEQFVKRRRASARRHIGQPNPDRADAGLRKF